jgi:DNA invertase Pin-like site-specific DNA recombinase
VLVLGYVRVSSLEQEHGYGPEVQAKAIEAFCAENGLAAPELVYESVSGESITRRKELQQVLVRVEDEQNAGGEAHLVFYRLDRLSRTLMDQETVVGRALRVGFRLHSTQPSEAETLDPAYAGDPMRTAIRQFMGIFSQLERATIQARLDSGLHAKALTGKSTGGRPPFGYMSKDKDIAIDPEEVPIVRRVFELHQHGLDQASIVAVTSREFPAKCGPWNKSTVSRMLRRRDLYAFGRYRTCRGVQEMDRPELVVLTKEAGSDRLRPLAPPSMAAAWEKAPDPVPLLTLSLLLSTSSTWISNQVKHRDMLVTWNKGKMLIPLESAKLLAEIIKNEKSTAESKPVA